MVWSSRIWKEKNHITSFHSWISFKLQHQSTELVSSKHMEEDTRVRAEWVSMKTTRFDTDTENEQRSEDRTHLTFQSDYLQNRFWKCLKPIAWCPIEGKGKPVMGSIGELEDDVREDQMSTRMSKKSFVDYSDYVIFLLTSLLVFCWSTFHWKKKLKTLSQSWVLTTILSN